MSRCASRLAPLLAVVLAAGLWSTLSSPVRGQAKKGDDSHAYDRAAIRAAMVGFVKAFESGDAKTLATHWSSEGEYQRAGSLQVRGRPQLEKAFELLFTKSPQRKAEVASQSLRFLSSTSAIDEGKVTVRKGAGEPVKRARYSALFVKEDGKWLLAQLTESPDHEVEVSDLSWLIGEWSSASDAGAEIRATYAWDAQKKFIHVDFKIHEKDKQLALSGKQVIGIDPATGGIRSWTFEANGGVGEADWHPDGDHWELSVDGTLPDGRTLIETNVLRRINDNTFTWQSVHRTLGDREIPDLSPVKVTRVK